MREGVAVSKPVSGAHAISERVRLFREGLWIAAGQGVAAIATLAGVRLLTELASPSLYGGFILVNGMLSLVQGVALQPTAQAALRFYPEYEASGASHLLRRRLVRIFARRWGWIAGACLASATVDGMAFRYLGPAAWALVAGTAGLDAWKSVEIVMRNAARRQSAYATVLAADAVARPAGAVLAAWALGASLESLLLGQAAGALAVLACTALIDGSAAPDNGRLEPERHTLAGLEGGMDRFAAPLVWMPVIGWVSGMADRYVVGGILGLSQAGIYGAAYGLASRPLLMVGTVTEATFRQPLYGAVSGKERSSSNRLLLAWLVLNVGAGSMLALLLGGGKDIVVHWILAAGYREQAAELLPWIAAGYVFVLANQALERWLYAQQRTGVVTLVGAAGAILAIAGALVGSTWFGLKGVAAAVPVYFAGQLALTTLALSRLRRTL